jgi:hypothetical protein
VFIAVRQDDHVARACPLPLPVGERHPASAAGKDVEQDDAFGLRAEHPRERRAALTGQRPALGVLGP